MKKKILIVVLVILTVTVPLSVGAIVGNENIKLAQINSSMSAAKKEEIEYKNKVITGEIEVEEDTSPPVVILGELREETEEEKLLNSYIEQSIALINKKLNKNYEVKYCYDREIMSAAVETLKTKKLTNEEYTLLKNYTGEFCCGVRSDDPLKDKILEIHGLTKAEYYGFSDDSVITQEEQSAVDSYLASRTE
ncbi:MAG: hypothetical protein ACI4I4_02030 [Acutalibacteraceae bacterium]